MKVELKVTPDKYLPHRYAGASGDFNPIHIDVDFAKQVGLPSNILHGLYTMAQVARANVNAAGGDPRSLKRLSVQFRGMGFPEQEITVTGKVKEERDGRVVVETEAAQGDKRIIRNAEAELDTRSRGRHNRGVEITPRQSFLLRKLVEAHRELDQPVGSKWIAEQDDVPWGPSTVRAELAKLEELGLLEHPHTSAGRVPTDRGYRTYVDEILAEGRLPVPASRSSSRRCAARSTRRCARPPSSSRRSRTCSRWCPRRRSRRPRSAAWRCCCSSRRWRWSS